jgi:uncharacterized protein (TIGR02145 family)
MKKLALLFVLVQSLIYAQGEQRYADGTATDQDVNTFEYIKYGDQYWSIENAEVVTYRDGTPIPQVTDPSEWPYLTTGAWRYYDNDPTKGKFYNWYAVSGVHDNDASTPNKEFAPEGWKVPSDEDWTDFENFLISNGYNYDYSLDGDKTAKSLSSINNWTESVEDGTAGSNQSGNNRSGFNAMPNGYIPGCTTCYGDLFGQRAYFYSSSITNNSSAWYRVIRNNHSDIYRDPHGAYKEHGLSVRFVTDVKPNTSSLILLNGTVSAENNQIKNVADPTDAQDVTTKSYVDNSVSNTYTQAEVDALINDLRTEISNQIDNDGDGYTEDGGDCDDSDSEINPVANEVCDNIDNNCNSEIDEGVKNTYYQDVDGDGFGLNGIGPVMSCSPPEGYVSNNQDCDDSNSALYPGAPEIIGDGIDNNCNGILDEYIDPRDNNIYRTIEVNGDIWLAEDLRFNSENSHNPFYDDPAVGIYSDVRMYWPDDNDALPDGWRIPTKEEWVNLFNYVGGYKDSSSNAYFNAGGKLKSNKPEDWSLDCLDSYIPGSNEINFNAVSYSFRTLGASGSDINSTDCNYDGRNQGVGWWTSTEASVFGPNRYWNYYIHLSNNYNGVTYVCDNDNSCDKIYEYITESKLVNSNNSEHSGRRMLRLIKESN